MNEHTRFRHKDIEERRMHTLIGIVKGIIADDHINQCEANVLHEWLVQNSDTEIPFLKLLLGRVDEMLSDNFLDKDESQELLDILTEFSGGKTSIGEMAKSSNLPINKPAPVVEFKRKSFLFTGVFDFGDRKACQGLIDKLDGFNAKSVVKSLDYLVIGTYANESWKYETFGKKIQHAMENREKGLGVNIITEEHFIAQACA